ncbi:MAG: VWA domain-containing protein [Leptospiraceae bacterium]|nr:VWA domain-containing protein [Leptospiraceae bacterium]
MAISKYKSILIVLLFGLFPLIACSQPRDYILVIDTSGSMSGSRNTIQKVKDEMPDFLETVNDGDSITIMTFDTEPNVGPTYTINNDDDRERVAEDVRSFKATGTYTGMHYMVAALSEKIKAVRQPGRQLFVVVMSDGQDDPPPWTDEELNLEEYRDPDHRSSEDPYYIYYVSLGKLQDPELQQSLEQLSPDEVRTVDAGAGQGDGSGEPGAEGTDDNQGAGLTDVGSDIEATSRMESWRKWGIRIAAIVAGLCLLFLLILLIYKFLNRHNVTGTMIYNDATIGGQLRNTYNVDKVKGSKMSVGPRLGADLRIKDIGVTNNIALKAKKVQGEIALKPRSGDLNLIQFTNQARDGLISSGDTFKIGNYNFEYKHGKE